MIPGFLIDHLALSVVNSVSHFFQQIVMTSHKPVLGLALSFCPHRAPQEHSLKCEYVFILAACQNISQSQKIAYIIA